MMKNCNVWTFRANCVHSRAKLILVKLTMAAVGYNLYVQSMRVCEIDCGYKVLHINVKYKARTPNTAMM